MRTDPALAATEKSVHTSTPEQARAEYAARIVSCVKANPSLLAALHTARELQLPQWCIAAGAIRNLVWSHIHGMDFEPGEIDLVYWDDADADSSAERDQALQAQLAQRMPQFDWDVTNQAGVHYWYRGEDGRRFAPFASTLAGMASWPETATAVGVSLDEADQLQIWAPVLAHGDTGLADLFALRLRHNPARVSQAQFQARLAQKRFLQRWPRLTLVGAD
ncbi:nucleotidyltransferase family protein [Chitinibacter sp. GC72]|uniref:nucleotidyltransferase family protein n=1 Tax=Chitinibacter sp. GC72 TaxID=1526917 RepID=UPI0012FB5ACA|nr:nucleotidyltransferase family protein [Chitinibacter sp. GC72]